MDVKKRFFIVFLILITACKKEKQSALSENFDWLVGQWERIPDSTQIFTKETWKKVNDTFYLSHGYSIQNSDTIWQEKVHLKKHPKHWVFEVFMSDEKNATPFQLTQMSETNFVAENPSNEFPKIIRYQKVGNQIHANIEGNNQKIDFIFQPKP